jgi:hypothetical protein
MSTRAFNSFAPLWRDLLIRLRGPVGSFTFWTYAIIGIAGIGGLAVWIEVVKYIFGLGGATSGDGIRLAINTYFPAVGCSAAQQLFIAEKQKTYLRSFGYSVSVGFLALCILSFLLQLDHPNWSLVLGIVCSIGAVVIWWIANGGDPTFHDTDPDIPVGGPTATPLPGDTTGFTV